MARLRKAAGHIDALAAAEVTNLASSPAPHPPSGTHCTIRLLSGKEVDFELEPTSLASSSAIFVLGVRKSGATLLNRIWARCSKRIGLGFVDVGATFAKHHIRPVEWLNDPAVGGVFRPGFVYGGFRSACSSFCTSDPFKGAKKVLLVRDPRDSLVSEYFSVARTKQSAEIASIDDWVLLNARSFRKTLQSFLPILSDPNLKLFRYEDVIMKKKRWVHDMLQFTEIIAPQQFIDKLVREVDVVPDVEDPTKFIRKVIPGDHAIKLRPATVEALSLIFSDTAERFGYRFK